MEQTCQQTREAPVPQRRGIMLILSAPSGTGKTTLTHMLLTSDSNLALSISATTRFPRPGERDGVDYTFLTPESFAALEASNAFLETANVFGHNYGTPRKAVEEALNCGTDVLFDIDWQGARSLARLMPEDCVRIFILPPSRAELERRLRGRASDNAEAIKKRLAAANDEMSRWSEADYVLININLQQSLAAVRSILAAERCRRSRQTQMDAFVKALMT